MGSDLEGQVFAASRFGRLGALVTTGDLGWSGSYAEVKIGI